MKLFAVAVIALVAISSIAEAAIPPPPADCVWGDGKCARKLNNSFNRWARRMVGNPNVWDPATGYGLIVENESISSQCRAELEAASHSTPAAGFNQRFIFDFEHAAGTEMYAVYNRAAGTFRVFGKAFGGPVIGYYNDAGYTAAKYPCAHDTGIYSIDYLYINVVEKPNGDLEIEKSTEANPVLPNSVPNGSGVAKKVNGPTFQLGIQHDPSQGFAFRYLHQASKPTNRPHIEVEGWTDSIGPLGPGTKTGKSRDFFFLIKDPTCDCDPEPNTECETFIASETCKKVSKTTSGKCVCIEFTADGQLVTVPCSNP